MELTEARLERAQKLITLTADEAVRWKETVKTISSSIEFLFGDIFLSTASISYNGAFTGFYRQELINLWKSKIEDLKIPKSENYSLFKTLGDPMKLREWII
jgi:dynein heavy chain